ncbi:ATP-binding protein [Vulcanisaeta distributa]|uniref:ATPase n=1 Tax=Vulcanisaeta distributa (strain DSM 14429 / JCM 11212 / NBRC 100878 / IC-017) TaxID=572478 RepID=E1QUF3_VULDI|nr:ATP-binding protein [Vulcanisaeta distributa]ADN49879.1 ATPase [Vulcanisaeta distributa DSM 14429]
MRRIKLPLALDLQVEFTDREIALKRIDEWVDRGMRLVEVVLGPEGCGKTAWLLQSVELLRDYGFDVIYINPLNGRVYAEVGIKDLRNELYRLAQEAISQNALARIAWIAYNVINELIKARRGRVAILADDVFQVIGVRESAMYVKALLNLIEYPPAEYERVITIVATSEGVSRREIGRHTWAHLDIMWNMARDGFRQLYEQIPDNKPSLEEAWKLTGGNPRMLGNLYENRWNTDKVISDIISEKRLRTFISSLTNTEKSWLQEATENPDTLMNRERIPLMDKLVELNLIIDDIPERKEYLWIGEPPPEKDGELGIGRYVAWQTPIHREAIRKVLGETKP